MPSNQQLDRHSKRPPFGASNVWSGWSAFRFLRLLSLVLFTFLTLLKSSDASAMTRIKTATGTGVLMNADNMYGDNDKQTIELTGNVQIAYDQYYLSCKRAIVNQKTQNVEAYGDVVMTSPQTYVEGDSISLSLKDHTGIIINGFVKSGQVIVEGAVIHKTGEFTYDADKASFTACTTCPTAWTFAGTKIHAELGGYAYIKSSRMEVAGVPIFWLPYLIVPLKTERQTGFLIPSFDYTENGGFATTFPFFWAISKSTDATFGAQVYSKRGVKGLLNYRYALTETSSGILDAGFIKDSVFSSDSYFDANHPVGTHTNRSFLTYEHYFELPDDFYQKVKIAFVSDLRYPQDFPLEVQGQGDPALENRISLTRNTELTHASIETDYYINQLKSNPIDSNTDSVHRWPELRYNLREQRLTEHGPFSDLLFSLKANYVNFAREDYAFDDVYLTPQVDSSGHPVLDPVTGNQLRLRNIDAARNHPGGGVFDPRIDVVRAGQRFYLEPELSHPFTLGALDILPFVNVRHTQYSFSVNPGEEAFEPSPYRDVVRAQVMTRMRFSRVYGTAPKPGVADPTTLSNWVDAESRPQGIEIAKPLTMPTIGSGTFERYRHEFSPELTFSGTPYLNQSNSPFFGQADQVPAFLATQPVSDLDFQGKRGIQFDLEDRVTNRNTATIALNNQLVRKIYGDGGASQVDKLATWRVAESYDFDEARRAPGPIFPWSQISSQIDVFFRHFETSTLNEYYPYHDKMNTSARVKARDDGNRFVELTYSQQYTITAQLDNYDYEPGRTEAVAVALGFTQKYLTFSGKMLTNPRFFTLNRIREDHQIYADQWSIDLLIRPPGNCWGIKANISQAKETLDLHGNPVPQQIMTHFDFDYNFGGAS
jgi:LPS-assembly protein